MKFRRICILVLLAAVPGFSADRPAFQCEVESASGWVFLKYNERTESGGSQTMVHLVGQEQDWKNPGQIQSLCRQVLPEIVSLIGPAWSHEYCEGDSSVRYQVMNFALSEEGSVLLGSPTGQIQFKPEGVTNGKSVRSEFKQVVSPYDEECHFRK